MKEIAIDVHGLTKSFGPRTVVRDLSLQVPKGEIYGFLGPNGSGKTTTLRMLCGLLTPDAGEGTCLGYDIRTEADAIKRNVGYMTQRFSLYTDLSIRENLEFVARVYGVPDPRQAAREAIGRLGLSTRADQLAGELSGGWKQRLALGCAILHEPPIIFLDEPTSGVDPISRRQFWSLIYELSGRGVTIFVTTHYMDEAEYCDRIGLIYRGELTALGTPEVLKTELMQEDVLDVSCERPQDAMGEIEKLPGIREVALFGKGLHVVAEDGEAAIAAIDTTLGQKGYRIERIEKIVPSLEDVFVSLIEARDRAESPQQEVRG
jgi:ABC-2 type transport system ATP-binding protein